MKIHIVQKGDTLWGIAKKYEVDFEEIKELNSHISSPDMIMPGMKIRIPSSKITVKKESQSKIMGKTKVEKMGAATSLKPIEQMVEDDKEAPKEMKVKMPQVPNVSQMPILGMEMKEKMKESYMPPTKMKEMPATKPMKEQTMDFNQHQSMPPMACQPPPVMPVHCHVVCHCCSQMKHHHGTVMSQKQYPTSPNHMMMHHHQPMGDYKHNEWQNHPGHMRMPPPVGNMHQNNASHRATNRYQENMVQPATNYQYNDLHQSKPQTSPYPTFENNKGSS